MKVIVLGTKNQIGIMKHNVQSVDLVFARPVKEHIPNEKNSKVDQDTS